MEEPLAFYYWASGTYEPVLATEWRVIPPDRFEVHLRQGVRFSDGTPFNADDVVATFAIGRLYNWVIWKYVDRIEKVNDSTVVFHMKDPSSVVPRYALREPIRSDSVYGTWAKRVQQLLEEGKGTDSPEWKQLRADFEKFRPSSIVGTGPYNLDVRSISESQATLVKVPTAWAASRVKFDRVVLYNGETPQVTPLVLSKQVDYATHGFPPATERSMVQQGIRVVRPPTYTGPAIFFNNKVYPLNRPEVRQAIAMVIKRDENARVSLGDSAKPSRYMAGFSDNLVPAWLTESQRERLDPYAYDPDKAAELLKSIGFRKGSDGVWVTDQGKPMALELSVPAEYADWSAAAENAAEQLTRFGIKTTVRAITFTQQPIEIQQGRFQMAIQAWGVGNPHPHFSFVQDLFTYNYVLAPGPGMSFDLKQKTKALGEVDLEQLVVEAGAGLDEAKQKDAVAKAAIAFNELLPIIPLWERYGNNAVLENVRVAGWPPDGDPIYRNSLYTDPFHIILIHLGRVHPAG
ncbi:MAG: ABC transporter substrate-binding protein [Limnochordaceae bacterium]|nr:ABC transporter substrate-binding protein [Limnochordaceae bacterium]